MVKTSLEFIESKTSLKNKKILVLGATYKEDVEISDIVHLLN